MMLALAQLVYMLTKRAFDVAAAEQARRLAALDDDPLAMLEDDDLERRRAISQETGYWEAYDALYLAEDYLLAAARLWLQHHPDAPVPSPLDAALRSGAIAPKLRPLAVHLAATLPAAPRGSEPAAQHSR